MLWLSHSCAALHLAYAELVSLSAQGWRTLLTAAFSVWLNSPVVAGKLSESCLCCCVVYQPSSGLLLLNSSVNNLNIASVLIKKVLLLAFCSWLCAPASMRCSTCWAWSIACCNTYAMMDSGVALLLLLFPCCSASLAGWLLCGDTYHALPFLLCCWPSLWDDLCDGCAMLAFCPWDMWSWWSQQLGPVWQALLGLPWILGVLRQGTEQPVAEASLPVLWGKNSNGNGCVSAESSLMGLVSLAQLCRLLDCEWWQLGTPVLGLWAYTLCMGTVLDILKSPLVQGFIAAAGWLLSGTFLLWCGISWATLGPVHVGVLSLGLSGTNTGLAQFNTGVVVAVFFAVAVFIMVLTSLVWKMGFVRVGGFPLSYCSVDVQKSIRVAGLIEHST